jgi:GNAT superfamily N-acetyltransferase
MSLSGRVEPGRVLRAYGRKLLDRHRSHWMILPLDAALQAVQPSFDARLVFDDPELVLEFIRGLQLPGTCEPIEIRSMQERGHLFVGLEAKDEWIGFAKIGWGVVHVLDYGIELELPPGFCFVLESYIVPEWRRRGAGRFLIAGTSIEMRNRGFTHRISHVRTGNRPMLEAARRVGYRTLGAVDFVSILGRKRFRPHPATLLAAAAAMPQRAPALA